MDLLMLLLLWSPYASDGGSRRKHNGPANSFIVVRVPMRVMGDPRESAGDFPTIIWICKISSDRLCFRLKKITSDAGETQVDFRGIIWAWYFPLFFHDFLNGKPLLFYL